MFDLTQNLVITVLWVVFGVVKIWAFVDCVRRPAQAFPAVGRVSKLLWLLLERAGSNILRELPPSGRRAGSISEEMRHLKRAAQGLEIAPGIRLSDHLYTNAIDYEKRRVHARLRAAAETWPPEFAPQAFLLLEASEVTSSEVVTGLGTVEIRNRIQHTGIIRAEVEQVVAFPGGQPVVAIQQVLVEYVGDLHGQ